MKERSLTISRGIPSIYGQFDLIFHEMDRIFGEVDRIFDAFWGRFTIEYSLPMEAYETKESFILRLELPGLEKEDIDVRIREGEAIYEFVNGGWLSDVIVAGIKYELSHWEHITVRIRYGK